MSRRILPYGRQHIDQKDIDAVVKTLQSDYLTDGPAVRDFERALAKSMGNVAAAACSNGTTALHLASLGLGLGQGADDVVIVPAITFAATANAPFMTGARIVFSDVDPDSGLMRVQDLADAYERAKAAGTPRAVFPVHLNGQVADMEGISEFCRQHGLMIIEDACHALGGKYPRKDGTGIVGDSALSDATCFSFHPVKTLAMGEGGAVASRSQELIDKIRLLRSHGITKRPEDFTDEDQSISLSGAINPWYQEMQFLGNNYRAPDILCALGLSQLSKLDSFVAKRRELVAGYRDRLRDAHECLSLLEVDAAQDPGWHLMVVLIDFDKLGKDREFVMRSLSERGIRTQVHYLPVHWHPFWKKHSETPELPSARNYYRRALSIPLFYSMSVDDVDYVASTLLEVLHS